MLTRICPRLLLKQEVRWWGTRMTSLALIRWNLPRASWGNQSWRQTSAPLHGGNHTPSSQLPKEHRNRYTTSTGSPQRYNLTTSKSSTARNNLPCRSAVSQACKSRSKLEDESKSNSLTTTTSGGAERLLAMNRRIRLSRGPQSRRTRQIRGLTVSVRGLRWRICKGWNIKTQTTNWSQEYSDVYTDAIMILFNDFDFEYFDYCN